MLVERPRAVSNAIDFVHPVPDKAKERNTAMRNVLDHPEDAVLPRLDEDLVAAARDALDLAARHCTGGEPDCRWYHASWPVLRALGAVNSPGSDDDFFLRAIATEFDRGARDVLVSGAADAGMLARVGSCLAGRRDVRTTVLDRCRTPLEHSLLHALRFGFEIDVVQADILHYAPAHSYDLICTHSFLTFFPPDDRRRLVARWFELLKPGGCVVTAQRIRPGETEEITRFPVEDTERLAAAAETMAKERGAAIGIDAVTARALAEAYGRHHRTYLIASAQSLERLFVDAGFELEELAPPSAERKRMDLSGAPANAESCRWRILARRPA